MRTYWLGRNIMWRQQVASRYYRRSARSTALGAWCRSTGAPLESISYENVEELCEMLAVVSTREVWMYCRDTIPADVTTPSVYWVLLGRPYVTRGLRVVDRTVGACPITCSPRHLTSHLFHSYISTTHSPCPQACVISFPCDFSVSQATSLGFWRQRDSHLNRYTSRIKTETSHMTYFSIKTCGIITKLASYLVLLITCNNPLNYLHLTKSY